MPSDFYMVYTTFFIVSGVKDIRATLATGAKFNDNKWHQVSLIREANSVSITLDNVRLVDQRKYVTIIGPIT